VATVDHELILPSLTALEQAFARQANHKHSAREPERTHS